MILKNLAFTIRRFQKNLTYSMFNVVGLAVGFSVVIYISLYINHELTYDQFIPSHNSVFRLSQRSYALTSPSHLGYLSENMDEIEAETLLLNSGNFLIGLNGERQVEPKGYYVTAGFFDVFNYPIVKGSYDNFSELPNAMVITETMEKKMFDGESALNKEIIIYQGNEESVYKIIAVLQDIPSNTHLKFNMVMHMPSAILANGKDNWGYTIYHGYVKTDESFTSGQFQTKVDRIFAKRALDNDWYPGKTTVKEILTQTKFETPLTLRVDDIHLKSNINFDLQPGGDRNNLWIFGMAAVFILLLAITNFINLATAQSAKKAKEVGVRKTLGSSRIKLVGQFLTESVILCLVAALLALGMVELFIPFMKLFLNFDISFSIISNPLNLIILLMLALFTGVLGGLYPAIYLTSFKPAVVLKGKMSSGTKGSWLRNSLVVFQFSISLTLGIFVYGVQDQLNYGLQKDPGFVRENLIVIDNSLDQLGQNAAKFKNDLSADSRFVSSGYFNFDLIGMSSTFIAPEKNTIDENRFRVYYQWADSSYLNTLGVDLIEGRNFNEMTLSDTSVIILNETAVRALGFEKPVGKRIQFGGSPGNFEIVGVVKDFHHQSFRKQVPPTAFVYSKYTENALAVRLSAGDVSAKLLALESIWKENTLQPFDYSFVDADFGRLFEEEQRLSKIVAAFTFLAFFVACLGILGLAGYLAERKTKEIGIRKVLGATVEQIVTLFSQQFIRLVFIAMLIAVPLSYYASSAWLNSYVYKVNIDPLGFVIICLSGLAIVVVAVSYHAIKSGSANPVNALKEE